MDNFIALYRRYIGFAMLKRWQYIFAWIFLALLLFIINYSIFVVGDLIDSVSADPQNLSLSIILIAFILAFPLIIEPLTFHFKTRLFASTVNTLVGRIYNTILSQDYSFYVNRQTGKLISKVLSAQEVVSTFVWGLEWSFLEQFAALVIPVVLIGIISPLVAIVVCIVLVFAFPFIVWGLKLSISRRNVVKEASYDLNTTIVDGIENFETVRSFGTEIRETTLVRERLEVWEEAMNRYQDTFRVLDFLSRTIGLLIFAPSSYILISQFNNEAISLGSVVVVVSYLIQMVSGVMSSVFTFRDVVKNMPVVEDFYGLLESKSSIQEIRKPEYLNSPQGSISFRDVTFAYSANDPLLKNLSFEINPKQNIALVGPSGGGKSTITRLLMRYYDIDNGEIMIDGTNVKKLAFDSIREIIGIVPQEPVLFNRSIFYNVGYALDNVNNENPEHLAQVIDACKRAHIHDFIQSLPDGYDTIVGERGVKLSGGQKQRLAIARVLLKDPTIIIFDEATSMLDSESEMAIQKAFKELSRDKTTIIIAHRLSTIIHCDNIFVIDQGKIAESGTHDELVAKSGVYANLWKIQSGTFVKGS